MTNASIGLQSLSQTASASSLFGGAGLATTAQSALETNDMQEFNSLVEQAKSAHEAERTAAQTESSSLVRKDVEVDKSSKLYQKAQELEGFIVKIMLSSMRNTINKTNLFGNENSQAQKIYEDMLYDEFSTSMTKTAGFGLAEQVYMQLSSYE